MTFLKIVTVSHKQGKLCGVFKLTSVCRDQGGTVRAERESILGHRGVSGSVVIRGPLVPTGKCLLLLINVLKGENLNH